MRLGYRRSHAHRPEAVVDISGPDSYLKLLAAQPPAPSPQPSTPEIPRLAPTLQPLSYHLTRISLVMEVLHEVGPVGQRHGGDVQPLVRIPLVRLGVDAAQEPGHWLPELEVGVGVEGQGSTLGYVPMVRFEAGSSPGSGSSQGQVRRQIPVCEERCLKTVGQRRRSLCRPCCCWRRGPPP